MMCPIFFIFKEDFKVKKIKMARGTTMTFEEGCNKYLDNCRQRDLREATIGHYKQSYTQFYKYFNPKMLVKALPLSPRNQFSVKASSKSTPKTSAVALRIPISLRSAADRGIVIISISNN